jgi:hypothetical protein
MPKGVKGFQKGHARVGGKQKGQATIKTEEIRANFANFLDKNMSRIQETFDELESKDKLKFIIDETKIVVPSQQSIDVNANLASKEKTIEDRLNELTKIDL